MQTDSGTKNSRARPPDPRTAMWLETGLGCEGSFSGATVWITGLPAAGKTTLAVALQKVLNEHGQGACLLDGDAIRQGLSQDLGLAPNDRGEQARRVMHVAALVARSRLVALVALVSPYRADRTRARALHEDLGLPFIEVWLDTPIAVCERRDPKKLYARARARMVHGLTGVESPYEPPDAAEFRIDGSAEAPQEAARRVLTMLEHHTAMVGPDHRPRCR